MKPKILLCENNQEVREALALMLEINVNASIVQCETGDEGIQLLSHDKFDAVISDYDMGKNRSNGIDVFQFILRQGMKLPFYLLTASCREFGPYSVYPTFKCINKLDITTLNDELSQIFHVP